MVDENAPIGERLRQLRGRLYTQRQLSERSGVSIDIIRKLEQQQRNTATVRTLHHLARALDVTLADLLGRQALPEHDQAEGVTALRVAVTGVDDLLDEPAGDALSAREAQRTLTYLWGTYWAGHYEQLTALLPHALPALRATYTAAPATHRAQPAEWLARAYWAAGCTLVHLRQTDAAFLAVRQAIACADETEDLLLAATLRGSLSWQLLVAGRHGESEALAVRTAREIQPAGSVTAPELSAYGSLVLTGATAAARAQAGGRARDLVATAAEVSGRLGVDRDDYQTAFGPSQIAMQAADVAVQTGEYGEAVRLARTMPAEGAALPLASRARHLTDRALAHTRLGQPEQAATLVCTAEQMAPDWAQHQALLKGVTRDLLHTRASRGPRLRGLAQRLGAR